MNAQGESLGVAIIGTASIDRFLDFYAGELGLDATPVVDLGGPAFETHWQLPAGSTARAALVSVGGSTTGRVLGIEFDSADAPHIASASPGPFIGYWNLNFYVDDIVDISARLAARGWRFWSRPVRHAVGGGAGAPVEAIFLGPDNVAINLVELGGPPESTVGELIRETAGLPRSSQGFSQVATTAHATRDLEAALAFHRDVLGMWPTIDAVLENPEVNELTGRPRNARTRAVWMRGVHPYGKIALSEPLNYTLPDRAARITAPAIGYLAQSFAVRDLDAAIATAATLGVRPLAGPHEIEVPGSEGVTAILMRSPGSGALVELTQR